VLDPLVVNPTCGQVVVLGGCCVLQNKLAALLHEVAPLCCMTLLHSKLILMVEVSHAALEGRGLHKCNQSGISKMMI
jgi:hypothetical protein